MIRKFGFINLALASAVLVSGSSLLAETTSGAPPYANLAIGSSPDLYQGRYVPTVRQLYQRGRTNLKAGRYLAAIKKFERALELAPENAQLNYVLGASHYLIKNDIRATWLLNKAVQSDVGTLSDGSKANANSMLSELKNTAS